MLTPYESRLGLVWLANAAGRIHHRRPEAAELAEWVNEHIEALMIGLAGHGCGIDASGLADAAAECQEGGTLRNRVALEAWRRLRAALRRAGDATQAIKPDPTALRLQRLAGITRHDAADLQVVEMALRYQTQPALESLVDDVYGAGSARFSRRRTLSLKGPAFAELLGTSANTLLSRCAPGRAPCALRPAGGGRRWRRVRGFARAPPGLGPRPRNRPASATAGQPRAGRTGVAGL